MSAEKVVDSDVHVQEDGDERVLVVDWTADEEKMAKRKLDLLLMPILTLGFFCLHPELDRGNMANAITDNFMADVGIDQDQFNVGQQMLSLGIVLTEIPSNMILYRLFLFGIVSTFQAFQRGYGAFIATRFLLGITESGFIPGGLWTLSTWYTRDETAKRVMIFYFGNQIGQASAKLFAYGILHMRGVGGQPGWFWLFALMGAFTVLGGFVYGFFLPDSFQHPTSAFLPNVSWFTERELHIFQTRVLRDDPMKGKKKRTIGLDAFKRAFTDWRIWVHFLITLCNNGPQRAFDTYAPSIVTSFGFGNLVSNALAAVGLFLQVPMSFTFSWVSDRFNRRGETVMLGMFCHLLGYIFNRIFTRVNLRGVRYFGVVWTQTVIMNANIAGIYGAQIFRSDDKPLYQRGFTVAIVVLAVGLLLAISRWSEDFLHRRRKASALK
ncbi:alternative sulfate transporter [Metarhizium rileyi]|uniref:Alternative sulfate transporter n=1 Tax=Metarhizium rileyi (strain RCEF 4871) TaxID=1649241 RepID=A0A162JG36_METRR|nr:alternative sulfate transporter [Metarhizium rileyi RCEF 4871]